MLDLKKLFDKILTKLSDLQNNFNNYYTKTQIDSSLTSLNNNFNNNFNNYYTKVQSDNRYDYIVNSGRTLMTHYDKNIYTEPDGSTWIRVIHHNNPASYLFASTNSFATYCYVDTNRWYDFEFMCYNLPNYEFMVKQKDTSSSTELKWRWIQNANPVTATYAQVAPGQVTYNTNSGYSDGSGNGGIYVWTNSSSGTNSARLCIANGTVGNWWGAFGCWTAYQGGLPGYPDHVCTTGYMDLYVRLDINKNLLFWEWQKWNSGLSECWGNYPFAQLGQSSWGTGAYYTGFGTLEFPENLFIETPIINVTPNKISGSGMPFVSLTEATLSSTGGYVFDNGGNYKYGTNLYFYCRGKWK